jgi:hypothetical protein
MTVTYFCGGSIVDLVNVGIALRVADPRWADHAQL